MKKGYGSTLFKPIWSGIKIHEQYFQLEAKHSVKPSTQGRVHAHDAPTRIPTPPGIDPRDILTHDAYEHYYGPVTPIPASPTPSSITICSDSEVSGDTESETSDVDTDEADELENDGIQTSNSALKSDEVAA